MASRPRHEALRGPLENLFQGLSEVAGLPKGALTLTGEKSLAELRTPTCEL